MITEIKSGMVFKKKDSKSPLDELFVYDFFDHILDPDTGLRLEYAVGISIFKDANGKYNISRNTAIYLNTFYSAYEDTTKEVSIDGILLTGIVASLQLGIRD